MSDTCATLPLVGGTIEITLYDVESIMAEELIDGIREEGLRLQHIFNIFDPTSELSLLNKNRSQEASSELLEVISTALVLCKQTDGRYDITKGKQFLARKRKEVLPTCSCTWQDVHIEGNHITLGHTEVIIDLGSIAKGYIADKLVDYAKKRGVESVFVDARGDMRICGSRLEVVNIQDPRNPTTTHDPFVLENSAVATSGDYKQYSQSFEDSHVLNAAGIASATVIAPTAMLADGLATALFVVGIAQGVALLAEYPHTRAVVFGTDGTHVMYNNFETLSVNQEHALNSQDLAQ